MNFSRRQFLRDVGLGVVAVGCLGAWGCRPLTTEKTPILPNVIYILADDLGYGDLGCYGQQRIKTPHLDKMAAEGIRFTQHYAGSTVCAPSRCALLTGKHTGHCTVRGNVEVLMEPDEPTIGTMMKQAGYATGCIGKWGVGHWSDPEDPQRHGFDEFFGYLSIYHAHNYFPEFLWKNGIKVKLKNKVQRPPAHYQQDQKDVTGVAIDRQQYAPELFTDEALRFLKYHKDQPFFLYLNYTIPHANNEATSEFRAWLKKQGKSLTDGGPFDVNTPNELNPMEVPDLGIYKDQAWPDEEKAKAAMITYMDSAIGKILAELQSLDIDDHTLVLFSSDNGPHHEGVDPEFFDSNGSLRGTKRDLYEGGIRVPMLARWPAKIKAGMECDHVSAFWDVLPTLADIAAVKPPAFIDGISMLPVLLGKEQYKHDYLYWEFHGRSTTQALRLGNWKAVRLKPSGPVELYNLKYDTGEQHDVSEQHPHIVAKAKKILAHARTRGDKWPLKDAVSLKE